MPAAVNGESKATATFAMGDKITIPGFNKKTAQLTITGGDGALKVSGKGVIKNRLPEKETDYAYASLFEETGIVVGVAILFAYLIFFYRSRKIAKEATGAFGRLLAFGIGFWITCQALVHIGVNCELLPTTGQTLPFVSSGGASLFVTGCAIGMLLNIGKVSAEENEKEDPMALLRRG